MASASGKTCTTLTSDPSSAANARNTTVPGFSASSACATSPKALLNPSSLPSFTPLWLMKTIGPGIDPPSSSEPADGTAARSAPQRARPNGSALAARRSREEDLGDEVRGHADLARDLLGGQPHGSIG